MTHENSRRHPLVWRWLLARGMMHMQNFYGFRGHLINSLYGYGLSGKARTPGRSFTSCAFRPRRDARDGRAQSILEQCRDAGVVFAHEEKDSVKVAERLVGIGDFIAGDVC